jgi:hypothetical protein
MKLIEIKASSPVPPPPPVMPETTERVQAAVNSVKGWLPSAGLSAAYLNHIHRADKQAGTAPRKQHDRGMDYG